MTQKESDQERKINKDLDRGKRVKKKKKEVGWSENWSAEPTDLVLVLARDQYAEHVRNTPSMADSE